MYTLSGVAVGAGIGVAPALVIAKKKNEYATDEKFAYETESEIDRYLKKSTLFAQKLRQIVNPAKDCVRDLLGAAAGFLTSKDNNSEVIDLINQGYSACMAARTVLLGNLEAFYKHNNDLKDDKEELTSLMNEFIHTLEHAHGNELEFPTLTKDVILITKDLTPAQLLSLETKHIKGVILEGGHDSGHLGVVLRELNIPSIFGVFDATTIKNDTTVLVDGNSAVVIVEPEQDITDSMLSRQDLYADQINDDSLLNITIACAVGTVGQSINNSLITTHGLGLLRSEFLFLSSTYEPSEEEMTDTFYKIFKTINKNAPITARTFDFADDKKPLFNIKLDESGPLKDYGACVGSNLLKKEIRALLRACIGQKITIVFPLVTKITEKDYLVSLAHQAIEELENESISHGSMELSFMIETPAAVLSAPAIAKEGSMMLIGTSSLAEYASAPCPPDNAFTPVLAKMIVMAAKAAFEAGTTLGIAGRFASRTELLPFFYKLGVTYLVTGAYNITNLKAHVERLNLEHEIAPHFSNELYQKIMNIYTGKELTEVIQNLQLLKGFTMGLFSFFKHKDTITEDAKNEADLELVAPVSGSIITLKEVPDLVISEKLMGDGVAIVPTDNKVVAPCSGVISRFIASNNAFAVRNNETGVEVYVTCGIGTNSFNGVGFTPKLHLGDTVAKGDIVFTVNFDEVNEQLESTVTSMIVINSSAKIARVISTSGEATAGVSAISWVILQTENEKSQD